MELLIQARNTFLGTLIGALIGFILLVGLVNLTNNTDQTLILIPSLTTGIGMMLGFMLKPNIKRRLIKSRKKIE